MFTMASTVSIGTDAKSDNPITHARSLTWRKLTRPRIMTMVTPTHRRRNARAPRYHMDDMRGVELTRPREYTKCKRSIRNR